LICTAARLMPDNTTAFIGTGIPMLAASLAQKMHAPNLVTVFEFGGTGAIIDELPTAVGGKTPSTGQWLPRASAILWRPLTAASSSMASWVAPRSTPMAT
jgi:acyl CoA:acetate/3-ketoacid CoA transferase beta subunit